MASVGQSLERERRSAGMKHEQNGNAIRIHPTSTHLFEIKSFNGIIVIFGVWKKSEQTHEMVTKQQWKERNSGQGHGIS